VSTAQRDNFFQLARGPTVKTHARVARPALRSAAKLTMTVRGTIQIRAIRAGSGERKQGFIDVGDTPNGPLRVPLVIVNGAHDGPVLCLTAGVHATEYPPIDTVMRAVNALAPEHLHGAVIAVPVVNTAMFERRTAFVSPVDGLNLNNIAPGNGNGTMSEMLAHVLLNEIIGTAQYYIDLHGGDFGELLLPFVGCLATGNSLLDCRAELLARVYGPELVVVSDGQRVFPFAGSIVHAAAHRGIVAIIAEAGGNGEMSEADTRVHLTGIRNVMRYLGMIEGVPSTPRTFQRGIVQFVTRATHPGLVRLKVRIGEHVAAGQEVAEIYDVLGDRVEVVRSQQTGIAGLIWTHKVVNSGDPIVRCWITTPAPPLSNASRPKPAPQRNVSLRDVARL